MDVVNEAELDPRRRATLFDAPQAPSWAARSIRVGLRTAAVTPVFETYWRFAAKRQAAYFARLSGDRMPWTDDAVIAVHRFTNAYRAADRVSQFLIRSVQCSSEWSHDDVLLRTLLFKFFNRIETWRQLVDRIGEPTTRSYDFAACRGALDDLMAAGSKVYSAAYIVPPPPFGEARKHGNHLRLLEAMLNDDLLNRLRAASSMRDAYEVLLGYPSLGPFLAYQLLIDINYSPVLGFDEMEFVVPGPGARDGIRKCFADEGGLTHADLIRYVCDTQDEWFSRLGVEFRSLWGRPLQLVDCQNLFCEVDKYARVAHPEFAGVSGRTRIKQVFRPSTAPLTAWFPPKWGLEVACPSSRAPMRGAGSRT
jgi:hypothetical protein